MRSTDTRHRPPELVALCASARVTIEAERMTHLRAPLLVHWELVNILARSFLPEARQRDDQD